MIAFFKRPVVVMVIGFALLAVVIFLAGPYVEFADYAPLGTFTAQLVLFALIVAAFVGWRLFKAFKSASRSDKLMTAVAKDADASKPSGEARQLQTKFEEAVALLNQKGKKGQSLYDRPWYVIIGGPGSGKTTALVNSGLHFPVAQKNGRAIKGTSGTRNCDWWFTDEAVLLDTAGRYTTQDSDADSDRAAWATFIGLLKKYRERRPVNGVILTVSAQDIAGYGRREWERYIEAARYRLDELSQQLGIQLPVYLMVTKMDLVSGFTEYFSDLRKEGRAQVWGVTFPYEPTRAGAIADLFPEEFDTLITRLNERLFQRIDAEADAGKRRLVFAFPQQMAALRDPLKAFVDHVFKSTRFDQHVLLRGVYFTSGTQWGSPLDMLIGASIERGAAAPVSTGQYGAQGTAYFVDRLFRDVIIVESGLAGTNLRLELRKGAAQLATYAAIGGVAVLTIVALLWSYSRNREYIAKVAVEVDRARTLPPVPATAPLDATMPRLDGLGRVVEVASAPETGVPIDMRWGLYQGGSLSQHARNVYQRELQRTMLPRLRTSIEQKMNSGLDADLLYDYLKAYLVLTQSDHWEPAHLSALVEFDLSTAYASAPAMRLALMNHVNAMVEAGPLQSGDYDPVLVERVRSTIRNTSLKEIVYSRIRSNYNGRPGGVRLDNQAGVQADRVLRFKDGTPLSTPIKPLYTPAIFWEVVDKGIRQGVDEVQGERWVWGDNNQPAVPPSLSDDVLALYETDYIRQWKRVEEGVEVVRTQGAPAADLVTRLGSPGSPLRGLLQVIDTNTFLQKPAAPATQSATGTVSSLKELAQGATNRLRGRIPVGGSAPSATPGASVIKAFEDIHKLVGGGAGGAPIDRTVGLLKELGDALNAAGAAKIGGASGADSAARVISIQQNVKSAVIELPRSIADMVTTASSSTASAVNSEIRQELAAAYQQEIAAKCRDTVTGNYPFTNSTRDAPPGDVAKLFGPGGLFDSFFDGHLKPLTDPGDRTRWRLDDSGQPVVGSNVLLQHLKAAKNIQEVLFPSGSAGGLGMAMTPVGMDRGATRFTLQINGQAITYRHDPQNATRITWSPQGGGVASVSFEDASGAQPNVEARGAWALLRLIDQAQVEPQGAGRAQLTFRLGGHDARVIVEPDNRYSPVTSRELLRFQCL